MPQETTAAIVQPRECPLCDTPLDMSHPTDCPRCDWSLGYRRRQSAPIGTKRDTAAMLMSVIPGLGHIYKGHVKMGVLLMLGGVFAVFAAAVAATATMGLGLFFVPLYWVAVMLQVYWLADRRIPAE